MGFYMDFHKIWEEQCEATRAIREAFGVENALDYQLGEKLVNFAKAADRDPDFVVELVPLTVLLAAAALARSRRERLVSYIVLVPMAGACYRQPVRAARQPTKSIVLQAWALRRDADKPSLSATESRMKCSDKRSPWRKTRG